MDRRHGELRQAAQRPHIARDEPRCDCATGFVDEMGVAVNGRAPRIPAQPAQRPRQPARQGQVVAIEDGDEWRPDELQRAYQPVRLPQVFPGEMQTHAVIARRPGLQPLTRVVLAGVVDHEPFEGRSLLREHALRAAIDPARLVAHQ